MSISVLLTDCLVKHFGIVFYLREDFLILFLLFGQRSQDGIECLFVFSIKKEKKKTRKETVVGSVKF